MADLSPVLEAYFGGQKQQSDLIGQARELSDSALRRQQAQEELKQRQATIDEIAKQHGIENERQKGQDELAHQIFLDTKAYHTNEATDKLIKTLQSSGVSPDQFHDHLATLGVPGFTPASDGLPQSRPTLGANISGVNIPEVNPVQTVNIPGYGPQQVPAWKTDLQQEVDKLKATIPLDIAKYNDTIGATSRANNEATTATSRANNEASNAERLQAATSRDEMNKQWHQLTGMWLYDKAEAAANAAALKLTGGRDPQEIAETGALNGELIASGQKSLKDLTNKFDKDAAAKWLAENGKVEPPKGTIQSFNGRAESLERIANSIPGIQKLLESNTKPGGSTANAIRSITQGLVSSLPGSPTGNDAAALFKSKTNLLTPDLESAAGLSLARAGSSPQMARRFDTMNPNLTDHPDIAVGKLSSAADEFLIDMSKQISTLPKEQRKAQWGKILEDHPNLLNLPGQVGANLYRAKLTGNYVPVGIK